MMSEWRSGHQDVKLSRSWVWTCRWSRRTLQSRRGEGGRPERTWRDSHRHRWKDPLKRSKGCHCWLRARHRSSWWHAGSGRKSWTYQWWKRHPWTAHPQSWAWSHQCTIPWVATNSHSSLSTYGSVGVEHVVVVLNKLLSNGNEVHPVILEKDYKSC